MSIESIIAEIEQLNVLDLVQLTKTLQEKWGVSAAPVAAAGPAVAAQEAAPAEAPVRNRPSLTPFSLRLAPTRSTSSKLYAN